MMVDPHRRLSRVLLLVVGLAAIPSGAILAIVQAFHLFSVFLGSLFGSGRRLFELAPTAVPPGDFFWPALALIGGIALFWVGWVVIFRGSAMVWPRRF